MARKTITTIMKKTNECVIYHDDGMYCSWTETQAFNFDLIQKTKAEADGIVLLVSEEEANNFTGNNIAFDDHEKWTISRDLIWMIYGEYPKTHWEAETEETKELVRFLRTLQI